MSFQSLPCISRNERKRNQFSSQYRLDIFTSFFFLQMPPKKSARRGRKEDNESPAEETAPPAKKVSRTESSSKAITEEAVLTGTEPYVRKSSDSDFDAKEMLKIISWNVAGLRGVLAKSSELQKLFADEKPDIVCLQETKLSDWKDCAGIGAIPGYEFVDSICTTKKGYAGTRTYIRTAALSAAAVSHINGFNEKEPSAHDCEGRAITSVFTAKEFGVAVVNNYVPNAGMALERLDYRVGEYDSMVRRYLSSLQRAWPNLGVIWAGDLNVAERNYDRYFASNFNAMQKCPGFTPAERASFRTTLAETHMVDAFRHLYPNASKAYTFYSNKFQARQKGNGWRLDYFVVSASLVSRVVDCFMLPEYTASDHVPLVLWLRKKK